MSSPQSNAKTQCHLALHLQPLLAGRLRLVHVGRLVGVLGHVRVAVVEDAAAPHGGRTGKEEEEEKQKRSLPLFSGSSSPLSSSSSRNGANEHSSSASNRQKDGRVGECSGEIEQSIRSCRMPECPQGRTLTTLSHLHVSAAYMVACMVMQLLLLKVYVIYLYSACWWAAAVAALLPVGRRNFSI